MIDQKVTGIYKKYEVNRLSPDPTDKHRDCEYFVLDLAHDPYAIPALRAYVESCKHEYPKLAEDITNYLNDTSQKLLS